MKIEKGMIILLTDIINNTELNDKEKLQRITNAMFAYYNSDKEKNITTEVFNKFQERIKRGEH